MATYAELQSEIADDLARTDLTTQIRSAIKKAIRLHERRKFYFNESRSLTFNTVDGQEFYSSSDQADIPNLAAIDAVTATINGNKTALTSRTYQTLEEWAVSSSTEGAPSDYCYYQQQIRLFPIPNAVYAVRVSGITKVAVLSLDADTNIWTTEGRDLIVAESKKILYRDTIRNLEMASAMASAVKEALDALIAESAERLAGGALKPTDF